MKMKMKLGIVSVLLFLILGIQITSGQKTDKEMRIKAHDLGIIRCPIYVSNGTWEFPRIELTAEGYTEDQITKIAEIMGNLGSKCCNSNGQLTKCDDDKRRKIVGLPDLEIIVHTDELAMEEASGFASEKCGDKTGTWRIDRDDLKNRFYTRTQIINMEKSVMELTDKCCDTTKFQLVCCVQAEKYGIIEAAFGRNVDFSADGYPVPQCEPKSSTSDPIITPCEPKSSTSDPKSSTSDPKSSTSEPKSSTSDPIITPCEPKSSGWKLDLPGGLLLLGLFIPLIPKLAHLF